MPSKITKLLLQLLMFFAACGFVVSLALHLLAWAGLQPSGNAWLLGMMLGLFPVMIPGILVSIKLTQGLGWRQQWEFTISGCPTWMRYVHIGLYVYAIVNFVAVFTFPFLALFAFPSLIPLLDSAAKQDFDDPPRIIWILFSSFAMSMYFSQITLAMTLRRRGLQPRCPNGHAVAIADKFCRTCGALIPPFDVGEVRSAA
ncbi:MAG TPA: hypothetical protein VFB68_14955 [Xanthobacteraceae bacterium]|nr:hypothetical protein [Xanthobacteraceae bacterium]